MAVGTPFGPEQFREAAEDRPLSFGVFRQWIVNRLGEAAAESITPDNFRDHQLYLFFKASTTPFVPGVGAKGPLTQPGFPTAQPPPSDPFAAPIIEPGPLAAAEGFVIRDGEGPPPPGPEDDTGALPPGPGPGAPGAGPSPGGQEVHRGFVGFWGSDGNFYTWDELEGRNRIIDHDPSRVVQPEAKALPGETESERLSRERLRRQFETTEARLGEEFRSTREFQEEGRRLELERFGQQLTADREERLAQLAAQPISWLQHAALSGQTPVVQPWMIPLMRPGQNLQVGQPIPGFQPGAPGAQQGGFIPGTSTPQPLGTQFSNLPELRRPSAQLFARMGPTAQQQFLGFRQARTGIPPQETLFRQRQSGPPGSSGGGFQQQRLRV